MEWISCEKELPVNGLKVQVYTHNFKLGYGVVQNNYDKSKRYWTGYTDEGLFFCGVSDVTHWRNCPDPPKHLDNGDKNG